MRAVESALTGTSSFGLRRAVRRLMMLAHDTLIPVAALQAAFHFRFEGGVPADYVPTMVLGSLILVAVRPLVSVAFGLDRWSFRMSGLLEAVRLAAATTVGTLVFVLLMPLVAEPGLPRSIAALEFFLTTSLMAAYRFAPRVAQGWMLERRRLRKQGGARRTLIVGAGNAGDLLLRDLVRSTGHDHSVVGFVDDDAGKIGTSIGGKLVLGKIADLPRLIDRQHASTVMLAIPSLAGERVREILRLCSRHKTSFKIIPASFSFLNERLTAAMLHDLAPEHLLPRGEVSFSQPEIRSLVQGRRVMVTGGAGTIGGEIARQVVGLDAALVVLVDINENELYLAYRRLKAAHPKVDVRVEVADIRDEARLHRLGREYSPQYVFHAAAHKHVPLMEDAPEEAIKNNVLGTLHVARMADDCGAERLVFISTDKAVRPSSVMGASKRIGEFIVRDLARSSATRMAAVRFGNVLGSAGSVVHLFKEQIERGGPVTVTDPRCTRYFMTVSEAVGLVLLAGLGGYGDVCVLDMGEAIRIDDLASSMITMAGRIPGAEIPIVYTGLRPGEKLNEETLTEDEEKALVVRDRIKVAKSPPPPADLAEQIEQLRRLAECGDRKQILATLRALVPTYRWTPNQAVPPAPPPTAPARPERPERAPRAVLPWPVESAGSPLIVAQE
jgi:FlaA1/EpsC-like NDP-sugar epimerase